MKRIGILLLGFLFCCAVAAWPQAQAQWAHKIIPINPPGAGTSAGLGTQGPGINPAGAITGFYSDANNVMHGFVRTPDGRITTFEAPGAGSESVTGFTPTPGGVLGGQGTYPWSINPGGAITGWYIDGSNVAHGFLRTPGGEFISFDAPPKYLGTGEGQGTFPANINPWGVIWGEAVDSNGVSHGFLRTPDGRFTMVDAPHAGDASGQGTFSEAASCINTAGAVTGTYVDSENIAHGFVRTPDGKITEFDVPGAGKGSGQGTYSWSINDAGAVTAEYVDADGVGHGYVRAPDGSITKFDVPGAGTGAGQGTIGEGINTAGVVTGNYIDGSGVNHGFVYAPDGRFTYFDVPGAGKRSGQGTIPLTNNPADTITGTYLDDEGVLHGFIRLPNPD